MLSLCQEFGITSGRDASVMVFMLISLETLCPAHDIDRTILRDEVVLQVPEGIVLVG